MIRRTSIVRITLLGILALTIATCIACKPETQSVPERQIGELIAVHVSFSLDEAMKGDIQDIDFWGVVVIKLDNGEEVDAAVDNVLAEQLRGGDMVVIERVKGSEMWRVVELADK